MPYSDKYWSDGQPLQGDSSAASLSDKYWIDGIPGPFGLWTFRLEALPGVFILDGKDVILLHVIASGTPASVRKFMVPLKHRIDNRRGAGTRSYLLPREDRSGGGG